MCSIKIGSVDNFRRIEARNYLDPFGCILVADPSDVNARIPALAKHYVKLSEFADDLQQIFVDNAATPEIAQLMSDAWLEVSMGEV